MTPDQFPLLPFPNLPNPKQCAICRERFAEEWMARRCEAQGWPPVVYRRGDVVVTNRTGRLAVCWTVFVHHAFGVKCHAEGPCPHEVTYTGNFLEPDRGLDRVWRQGEWTMLKPGLELVTTLQRPWREIHESDSPAEVLVGVNPAGEWKQLWSYFPERRGRRAGRRLIPNK